MTSLNDYDLHEITGGISIWVAIGIGAIITFIAGVVDGIVRPLACRK